MLYQVLTDEYTSPLHRPFGNTYPCLFCERRCRLSALQTGAVGWPQAPGLGLLCQEAYHAVVRAQQEVAFCGQHRQAGQSTPEIL